MSAGCDAGSSRFCAGSKVIFTILIGGTLFGLGYHLFGFRMVKRKNLIDSDSGESDESGSDLDSVSVNHFSC